MTRPGGTAEADQYTAAVNHTRRDLDALAGPLDGTPVDVSSPPWVLDLATRINTAGAMRSCPHLLRPGPQPINGLAWAPDARLCSACARDATIRAQLLPGGTVAERAEADETCDACHQHRPGRVGLCAFQTIGGPFLIWCGLCRSCRQGMTGEAYP